MRTAGLDIATHTGIAMVGCEDGYQCKTLHIPKMRGFLRLQLMADEIGRTMQLWEPDLVVIEDYAFFRNVGIFITLVELGTVIRERLQRMGLKWVDVNVATLKRWTLDGHTVPKYKKGEKKPPEHTWGTKEMMAAAVEARWGFKSDSHDIIDAYALAQMGQLGNDILGITGVCTEFPLHLRTLSATVGG